MINEKVADRVIHEAMKTGADFAEIFCEDKENTSISILNSNVEDIVTSHSCGAGVRILLQDKSIYVYTNDMSEEGLLQAASEAAAGLKILKSNQIIPPDIRFAARNFQNRSPIQFYPSDVEHRRKIELLQRADIVARGLSPEITQVSLGYGDVDQRILVCNSEGVWAEDRRVRTRVSVSPIASSGTEMQTGGESPGRSMGFEMFESEVDIEAIAKTAAQQAITMLHAEECPAAVVPVVIDGGFGGVIFHEACGHALEASSVARGDSVFSGKMGQRIAADCVTAYDDGTIENAWGTLNVDDEGTPTQKNLLIENGILKSYLVDKIGQIRMGDNLTGSGRRQDYTYAPTSRMNNTYIAAGRDDEESMIQEVKEGLYAKSMGGGSVNPLTGEFNFAVREGYWIKDGDLKPVRGATLVGKGSEILMQIDRVGPTMTMGAGVCGAASGSVPTNVGQPRIRVSSMTVGGKGEAVK